MPSRPGRGLSFPSAIRIGTAPRNLARPTIAVAICFLTVLVLIDSRVSKKSEDVTNRLESAAPNESRLLGKRYAALQRLVDTGRLQEAQDGYLEMLAYTPTEQAAKRGLMAVREKLAGGNPALLRRQARAYRLTVTKGQSVPGEHYTSAALALLSEASLLAALEIEGRALAAAASIPTPRASPRRGRTWRPARPVSDEQGPRYFVRVGSVFSLHQAKLIAEHLRQAGFDPTVTRDETGDEEAFRVVSDPVDTRTAERRAAALVELGFATRLQRLPGDMVQIQFGLLMSKSSAEDLARRIRATGYSYAGIVGGGPAYTVVLGPARPAAVEIATKLSKSRYRGLLAITVTQAQ